MPYKYLVEMLDGKEFRRNLQRLSSYYHENIESPELAMMVAKLSILELSGWIEECVRQLARSSVGRQRNDANAQSILNQIIDRTHGVSYDQHVRRIMSVALGASSLSAVEQELNKNAMLDELKAQLNTLHKKRNSLAHTFTQGTPSIDAPEITLKQFDQIFDILLEFSKFALKIDYA